MTSLESSDRSYSSGADDSVRYSSPGSIYTENACDSIDIERILLAAGVTRQQRGLVTGYLKMGWAAVSKLYRKHTVSREDMLLLGRVRQEMVAAVFECYRHANVHMDAFGTTGVTSDYDVSLMGPNSCFTMWDMFESFVAHYHSALPIAMDVNLYNSGMYEATTAHAHVEGMTALAFPDTSKYSAFTLTSADDDCRATMLTWALVKVVEGASALAMPRDDAVRRFVLDVLPASVTEHLDAAEGKLAFARALRAKAHAVAHEHYRARFKFRDVVDAGYSDDSYDDSDFSGHDDPKYRDFLNVVVEYGLQFHYAKLLNARLYSGSDHLPLAKLSGFLQKLLPTIEPEAMSMPELLCRNMYFSVEGAYTQGTVNVVVHEMQAGKRLALDASDYLCSAVENYGELLKHVAAGHASLPERALKYSKYVYRIMYAAGKFFGDGALSAEAEAVKAEVVKLRDEPLADVGVLRRVFFHEGMALPDYLSAVASEVSTMLRARQSGGGYAVSWIGLAAVTVAMALIGR